MREIIVLNRADSEVLCFAYDIMPSCGLFFRLQRFKEFLNKSLNEICAFPLFCPSLRVIDGYCIDACNLGENCPSVGCTDYDKLKAPCFGPTECGELVCWSSIDPSYCTYPCDGQDDRCPDGMKCTASACNDGAFLCLLQ